MPCVRNDWIRFGVPPPRATTLLLLLLSLPLPLPLPLLAELLPLVSITQEEVLCRMLAIDELPLPIPGTASVCFGGRGI